MDRFFMKKWKMGFWARPPGKIGVKTEFFFDVPYSGACGFLYAIFIHLERIGVQIRVSKRNFISRNKSNMAEFGRIWFVKKMYAPKVN